jgi:serine/threonine protein kinase
MVWLVRGHEKYSKGQEYALKVSMATDEDRQASLLFEVKVLQYLERSKDKMPKDTDNAVRVPFYVGHSVSGRSGNVQVCCVMTRLFGVPLDQWIYGVDEDVQRNLDIKMLIKGPIPGGAMGSMPFSEAMSFAKGFLSGMCQTFAVLSNFALHRDISAHNILLHKHQGNFQISVVDFGLAASALTWDQDCLTANICGDPRYFVPAAWMLLANGADYLVDHPDKNFLRQYQERLDHFGMGILCLETFFTLWNRIWINVDCGDQLYLVYAAWCNYWHVAIDTFQVFHRSEIDHFRREMSRGQRIAQLAKGIENLVAALRLFARTEPENEVSPFFSICAELLDSASTLSFLEISTRVPPCPIPVQAKSSPLSPEKQKREKSKSKESCSLKINPREIPDSGMVIPIPMRAISKLRSKSDDWVERTRDLTCSTPCTVTVTFSVTCDTQVGEDVRLVGNVPSLGDWNPIYGAAMTWTEGHVWVTQIHFQFPAAVAETLQPDEALEFKYVMMTDGNVKGWEQTDNRSLTWVQLFEEKALGCQNRWGDANVIVTQTPPRKESATDSVAGSITLSSPRSQTK